MNHRVFVSLLSVAGAIAPFSAFAQSKPFKPRFEVIPREVNNDKFSVAAFWRSGLGCPTPDAAPGIGCLPPDDPDPRNEGLTLAKSVNSGLPGQAVAELKGVKGSFLTELGYDLRKAGGFVASPQGSECNDRSPRIEITANNQPYFIPCTAMDVVPPGSMGWVRLRTVAAAGGAFPVCAGTPDSGSCAATTFSGRVQTVRIVLDTGPDSEAQFASTQGFGVSILDNVEVNGRVKGRGPDPRNGDEDEGQGRDKDGREFYHRDSPSHPEQSVFEFHDAAANMNLVSVNGVTGIAYSVGPLGQPCVSFSGNGLVNGNPGYLYSFLSCDLSAVGAGLGTYTITVTGPVGTLPYNQSQALDVGYVEIHK